MSDWLDKITNAHIRDLIPYESARRLFAASEGQSKVWLNANESPTAETFSIQSEQLNRYPDCQPHNVLASYAKYANLTAQQIVVTRGADEGIELLIRAFCQPGVDKVLVCPPTYGMYAISANTFNVGVEKVPLRADFSVDVAGVNAFAENAFAKDAMPEDAMAEDAMAENAIANNIKLVFLCSPNNPTGTLIPQESIESIAQAYQDKAIVVLDEAYIEFSTEAQQTALLNKYRNLVILRTLSKGFALAGIRCGFVLSSPEIKSILLKVIAPYPVPDPVAQIAAQALSEQGIALMHKNVSRLSQALSLLSDKLSDIAHVSLIGEQCGNFVLFKSEYNKALMTFLVDNNMLIRDQSKQLMLDNCLRISIGTPAQNTQLVALIHTFFARIQNSNNQEAVS